MAEKINFIITNDAKKSFQISSKIDSKKHACIKSYNATKIKGKMTCDLVFLDIHKNNGCLKDLILPSPLIALQITENNTIPVLNSALEELYLFNYNTVQEPSFSRIWEHENFYKIVMNVCLAPLYDFSRMKFLNFLSLTNCHITSMDNVIISPALEYLILDNNQIESIDSVTFPETLLALSLINNLLTAINCSTNFSKKLKALELENNQIESFCEISIPSLEYLNLKCNKLKNTAFLKSDNLPALLSINLTNNNLSSIDNLPNSLHSIIATENPIKDFSQLPNNLQYLEITRNESMSNQKKYAAYAKKIHNFDEVYYINNN